VAENASMNQNNRTTSSWHLLLLSRGAKQSASSGATLAVFCKGRDASAHVLAPPSNINAFILLKAEFR